MLNHPFRLGLLAACLSWQAAGLCQGASAAQPRWSVNSWGASAPLLKSEAASAECREAEGAPGGMKFQVLDRRSGDAELVLGPAALQPGRAYEFSVKLRSLEGTVAADVFFRRNQFAYETSAIRTVTLTPQWTTVRLRGIYLSDTPGAVRLAVRGAKGGLCVGSSSLQQIAAEKIGPPPAAQPVKPRFFGVHVNRLGVHRTWPAFDPGLVRLWDTGTTWALLEPQPGPIDWRGNAYARRLDFYVDYVRRNNPRSEILLTIGMTPQWAAPENAKKCNNSGYGPRSCMAPTDLGAWRRHVRELAQRYKGVIHLWEVWNESDVWVHWDEGAAKLYQVVKAASEELKAVDPANVVIGPNVTGSGLRFLNDFLDAGGGKVVDGLSVHFYFGRSPQSAQNGVRNLREIMAAHQVDLPIWNTETGVSCISQAECKTVRAGAEVLDPRAALARGLLGQAAMGVVNTNYYTYEGAGRQHGGPALVEDDFRTPTPEGRLYELLTTWMLGATIKPVSGVPEGMQAVSITRDGRTAYAAWSIAGAGRLPRSLVPGVGQVQGLDGKPSALAKGDVALDESPVLLSPGAAGEEAP